SVCTGFVQTADTGRDHLRLIKAPKGGEGEKGTGRNPLSEEGVAAGCDSSRPDETRAGDGIRTHDVQLGKLPFVSAKKLINPFAPSILRAARRFASRRIPLRAVARKRGNLAGSPMATR